MKRIVLFLFIIAMLPLPASAATPFKATLAGEQTAYMGEELCITLSFSDLPEGGLCGVDLELGFDGNLVSFTGASISGLPEEGDWCGTGRVEDGKYLYFIFDEHEDAQGFAPIPLKDGNGAVVTFTFAPKATGRAVFSLATYGAVTGTLFAGGSTTSVYGQGNSLSVEILKRDCPDKTGKGYTVKDGIMYVRPGITAAELGEEGTLYTPDGSPAEDEHIAFIGDSFEFINYNPLPVAVFMDVNGDGLFSTADYLRLKLHLKGIKLLTGTALFVADADGDGTVTASDSFVISAALAGTAYPF